MTQKRVLIIFSILVIILQTAKSQLLEDQKQIEARQSETDITKIADYLNNKIQQLLAQNPNKITDRNNLAAAFNAARSELENSIIKETASEEGILKAEQALENFKIFLSRFRKIEAMCEAALKDLSDYETDPKYSVEEKFEALMLLLQIKKSSSLADAEKVLKFYEDFKNGESKLDNATNLPSLTDEHRKYFEEILKILKDHFTSDLKEIDVLLNQILKHPELLEKLYEALVGFAEEDVDDFLEDLWSLIF